MSKSSLPFCALLLLFPVSALGQEPPHISLPAQKTASQTSDGADLSGKMLARISDELRGCTESPSNSERLRCYDMVTKAAQIARSSNAPSGAWALSPGVAGLAATSTTTRKGAPHPGLFIKCRQDQIFAYIEFGENPFPREDPDGHTPIKTSITERKEGEGTATFSSSWTPSSAKSAIGIWDSDKAVLFVNHIRKATSIAVIMEPIVPPVISGQDPSQSDREPATGGAGRISLTFYTDGAESALAPILASCHLHGTKPS